jgi:ABC-type sugar transport system substrate-binding protein
MTITKTRRSLTALVAALSVAAGATGVAAAHSPEQAKLTIHYSGDGFYGKVKSSKANCLANRTVTIHGPHGQTLKDTTEDNGTWDTGNSGQAHGKFYATVNARGNCLPLVSKTLSL